MKRRSFLTLLGLAPVVASARPQRPDKVATVETEQPFIFANGKAIFNPASINTITAGTIRSTPNRYGKSPFVISLEQGRIVIDDHARDLIDVKAKSGFAKWSRSL